MGQHLWVSFFPAFMARQLLINSTLRTLVILHTPVVVRNGVVTASVMIFIHTASMVPSCGLVRS